MAAAVQFLVGLEGISRPGVVLERPTGVDGADPPQPAASTDPDARLTELLARIAHGEQAALESLYDLTLPRVFAVARRICVDSALAEEVTEDVYFQVWREAARFDPARAPALPWLLMMARSTRCAGPTRRW